jgi:hypothetical protein
MSQEVVASATPSSSESPTATSSDFSPEAYLTMDTVTADQQNAYAQYAPGLHFHPAISPPVLGFDPSYIQNEFDPFELDFGALVDFNASFE